MFTRQLSYAGVHRVYAHITNSKQKQQQQQQQQQQQ